MKTIKTFTLVSFLMIGMTTSVFASWWNPFTWTIFKTKIQTQQENIPNVINKSVHSTSTADLKTDNTSFKKELNIAATSRNEIQEKINKAGLQDRFLFENNNLYFLEQKVRGFVYTNLCYYPNGEKAVEKCIKVTKNKYIGNSIIENGVTLKATEVVTETTKELISDVDVNKIEFKLEKSFSNGFFDPKQYFVTVAKTKEGRGGVGDKLFEVTTERWGCGGDAEGCEGAITLIITKNTGD